MRTAKPFAILVTLCVAGILANPSFAQNPYLVKDNTQIVISGTVASTDDDSIVLDYGGGTITVELGGWDWLDIGADEQQEEIKEGDRVVVQGEVDDELFERTKIKADYVYIQDMGTQFATTPNAQQQQPQLLAATWTFVDFDTVVQGTVTSVSQEQKEFALRTSTTSTETLIVDTSNLENDPLDKDGYQQIKQGDKIAVSGDLDANFLENRTLVAENVVSLDQGERLAAGSSTGGMTTRTRLTTPAQPMRTTGTQMQ